MKKIISLILIIFSLINISSAQDSILNRSKLPKTVYMNEDFVDFRNGWDEYDNAVSRGYIKDSKYYFESKQPDNSRLTWMSYNIDPTHNYYIEMEFALVSGPDDFGNGLLFNHTSTKKQLDCQFLIAANGYFKVNKTKDDVFVDLKPWTATRWVKRTGNNRLGIFMKGANAYFYINDHLVFTMKRPDYTGSDIGFIAAKKTVLAIDKFVINYNPNHVDEVENAAQGYKKVVLKNINTNLDEGYPVVSADGKMMVFSRTTNSGHMDLEKTSLMYSEYDENSKEWTPAKPLPANINQEGQIQIVSISPDKKTLIIDAVCNAQGKYIKDATGICLSHKTATGWSDPENVPIDGLVNRDVYSSYSLSSNGKALIISVAGQGSYGERDLYVSLKQNGKWTAPKNLGAVVNSFADDFSPCLAPDNVTLYYSSIGKPGYGKSDIFVTRRLDETWTNWSEPKNLGPDINTSLSESGLQVDAYGQYAYMNMSGVGKAQGKICKIELPEAARPKPVVIVTGKVYNMMTNKPISASVIYENMETGNEEGTAISSAEDGSFVIVLPYGLNYGLTAKTPGFMAESKNINLKVDSLKKGFAELSVDLYVMPLVADQSIKLNNIFFAPDKFELVETSFPELDRLANIMNENPNLQIQVEGHTDKGGANATEENLQKLSENRANSVKTYLTSKGIDTKRISTIGYGNTHPISTIQSQNRRVEVKITNI